MFTFDFDRDDFEDNADGAAFEVTEGDVSISHIEPVQPKCHDLKTLVSTT